MRPYEHRLFGHGGTKDPSDEATKLHGREYADIGLVMPAWVFERD